MADELEVAEMNESLQRDMTVQNLRDAASKIPKGEPGDCVNCGETFERLVKGSCARCRDKLGLS